MSRRGTLWFGWALAVLAIAGFARLGFWQYARMHQKQALLARAEAAMRDRTPHPLAAADGDDAALAWVAGEGRLDAATLLLDNQIHDDRPGLRVYCVLHGATGPARLVDFGWLPVGADRRLPPARCPAGALRVRGLSAPPPSSGIALGPALQPQADGRLLLTRIDLPAIAAALKAPLARHVVRLDPALPIGYARDLDLLPNTLPPSRHLGYAVQWWALSLAVLATALFLTFRRKAPRA